MLNAFEIAAWADLRARGVDPTYYVQRLLTERLQRESREQYEAYVARLSAAVSQGEVDAGRGRSPNVQCDALPARVG